MGQESGATHLELDTGLRRTDAQRFYEREGSIAKVYRGTGRFAPGGAG